MISFALLTVTLVVLFITFHLRVTVFVVFVILLVIVYMTAICHYWGLYFNTLFAVNLSIALGIAIDFSVHIAHKYLTVQAPDSLKTD